MPTDAERHLASLLLHVRPDRQVIVRAAIAAMPGTELHIEQPGKMVVTVEGPHEGWIADRMTALHLLDGVFSAVMVFHHIDRHHTDQEQSDRAAVESAGGT
ncbi:chaperone NapD [Azospirillum sp. YIM B02556]|uniref:Chaperone NapD n=1 Tax=Azospirillum endophyticum TaxID=2800326 RepID=A0ABS1FB46_9PROT|nr:chaperone NapD [Azospirillum endophyticum]MBK1840641.1 chaperone NapD [Azospirillum endophyticum]